MAMAVTLGDCSRDDADLLRRAMGSKRGVERIESDQAEALRRHGAPRASPATLADSIYVKILSFANFGFAESHALSFALLVYASSWFKLHYPAAFLAGLLRNQPMGFYSPQSLVGDARRHGVDVRRPDVTRSAAPGRPRAGRARPGAPPPVPTRAASPASTAPSGCRARPTRRPPTGATARSPSGSGSTRCAASASRSRARIVAARDEAPFADVTDLSRRAGLTPAQLEALATAGAFDALGPRPPAGAVGGRLRRGRRAPAGHHARPGAPAAARR